LDIGIQTAFHRFAVTQDAPVRNAQLGRSSAAQVARDPARLDEGVGEAMDRGELGIRIRHDGDLRLSAVRRHCRFRLEKCQFRHSTSSAIDFILSALLARGTGTARIDVLPAMITKDGGDVFYKHWGSGAL
jgi:hypothetical protein